MNSFLSVVSFSGIRAFVPTCKSDFLPVFVGFGFLFLFQNIFCSESLLFFCFCFFVFCHVGAGKYFKTSRKQRSDPNLSSFFEALLYNVLFFCKMSPKEPTMCVFYVSIYIIHPPEKQVNYTDC